MKAVSAKTLLRAKRCLPAALALPLLVAGQAAHSQADFGAMTLSASVHEALLPGPTIFDDAHELPDAGPLDRAEFLYLASQGENLSGRSTTITSAFASALAVFNHTGGVGVTSFIGADPSPTNPDAIEQLAAHATWTQDFANNDTEPQDLFAILHIPALQVGLIGVPPDRSSVSATETAEAEVTVAFIVTHADGTTTKGSLFEFGLRAFETQFVLGPGHFSNFADVEFLGVNDKTLPLFDSFKDNGDNSNPRFSIDAVSTKVDFGTLQPGDTLDVVYQLTAVGTTGGGEEGFVAFLGDPFEVDGGTSDAFVVTAGPASAAVPEPATWALVILGFGLIAGVAARRRAWATPALAGRR